MRLFVAVDLPGPVGDLIRALPRPLRHELRWTTPAQWHITVRFLGEVADTGAVVRALSSTSARLGADGAGATQARLGPTTAWFPGQRVLHVPVAGLERLADLTRDATSSWGPDDEPPFAGHLTLARVRHGHEGPADLAGQAIAAHFTVPEMVLYASSLSAEGAVYEAVSKVALTTRPRT